MKLIRVEDAVGCVLPHDMTEIVKDQRKGVLFRKGHIIEERDIPLLLKIGKEHIYVLENDPNLVHEEDAAHILSSLCLNDGMRDGEVKEGKIEIFAERDGLFEVNREKLNALNLLGDISIATRYSSVPVKKGDKLAGMRIIPLLINKGVLERAKEAVGNEPILSLKSFRARDFGVVTTGSEVYKGRIKDTFTPVIEEKLAEYGSVMKAHEICDDDPEMIKAAIRRMKESGLELIICTGGMSVDPDDRTPLAIRESGADIVSYGSPVLPGSMLLVSYMNDRRGMILGLPGCVMYSKRTVFDLILPSVMSDTPITKESLARLGNGGLCLGCEQCRWPNCMFGKGLA